MLIEKLAHYARNFKLSDIHMHSNEPIALRINGEIEVQEEDFITLEMLEKFIIQITDEEQAAEYAKNKQLDMALSHEDLRFRVNIYNTSNGPAIVMRKIEMDLPAIEVLNLPDPVVNIANEHNGLVLVTGPTGSGKSTTLAALINKINMERKVNIITAEDPIEFIHQSKKGIVSQREVGKDTLSFGSALKAMLREDPDVILVGEMRDLETISLALTAAETGHLVFGTLHTNGAPNSINRILDVFPPQQQAQARSQLSQSLRLVVTQSLLKKADGSGRVAAFEVMVNNIAIANLIRENKVFQISQAMETGKALGMVTMEESIRALAAQGIIGNDEIEAAGGH